MTAPVVTAEQRAERLFNAVCAALSLINAGHAPQAGTILLEARRQDIDARKEPSE